jgi:tRNA pseudouridine38-40 synthase
MRNILLEIEYDGTDYSGWQYQLQKKTIQGTIENGLKKILQETVSLVGASRTDAGVSALCQCANFLTTSRIPVKAIQPALNSLLPHDIYIKQAYGVHLLFNARFNAKSKIYRYQIIPGRSPLLQRFAWELNYPLDNLKMQRAAQLFIGERDFRPFCDITDKSIEGKVKVVDLKISVDDNTVILIEANRFLYKMVRRIVGCLVDLGRGKITKNDIIRRLAGKSHQSFMVAPAQGLTLLKVNY